MNKTQDGYERTENPGAVINTDNSALTAYKRQKLKSKQLDNTANEVSQLKTEVSNIKSMLEQILEKLSK